MPGLGPHRFLAEFERTAQELYESVLREAKQTYESRFTIDISVESGVQEILKAKLLAAGFKQVEFEFSQRDGDWIVLDGNPYAAPATTEGIKECLSKVETLLESAKMWGNRVILNITIPHALQPHVSLALVKAGWRSAEFIESQREGNSLVLTV